jgi:hypothetical protein
MVHRLALVASFMLFGAAAGFAEPSYPSPAGPWDGSQYVDFYFAHSNGHQALPHLRSEKGRALFLRLTDRDNVRRILAAPLPVAEKRRQIGLIAMATGAARGAYTLALAVGEPLAEEVIEVRAFNLFTASEAAGLDARAPGAAAWTTALMDAAACLGEDTVYSPAQRARLAEAVTASLPRLGPLLSAEQRARIAETAGRLGAASGDPGLRGALAGLTLAIEDLPAP